VKTLVLRNLKLPIGRPAILGLVHIMEGSFFERNRLRVRGSHKRTKQFDEIPAQGVDIVLISALGEPLGQVAGFAG